MASSKKLLCSCTLLITTFLITGCANLEYTKNLKPEDLIYKTTISSDEAKDLNKDDYFTIGANKHGFVGSDMSASRVELDAAYPIISHDESSLNSISDSHNHRLRLGQAIAFAADLDIRTSGFLKDNGGRPISISGKFEPNANSAMSQGVASGVVAGGTLGAMSVNSINSSLSPHGLKLSETGSNSVMGGQMALGLIGGLISGMIDDYEVRTTTSNILKSKSFGEIMESTSISVFYRLPTMGALGPDGLVKSALPIVIQPGIIKRYFLRDLGTSINYKKQFALITLVGTYRGKKYEGKYPNTFGWSYHISNMAHIELNPDEIEDPEKSFLGIRREVKERNLL